MKLKNAKISITTHIETDRQIKNTPKKEFNFMDYGRLDHFLEDIRKYILEFYTDIEMINENPDFKF